MSAPADVATVEYPSPSMKKTGTTEQVLLTNHKTAHTPGAFYPSPPRWPRRSLYTAPQSCSSLVGCLSSSHAIGTQRETGLVEARWSNMSAPQSDATVGFGPMV
uniref:Uncharacterized protein n=1 Tax=Mesocestoides corti TaxID=53468 RepID=A0A5K3FPT7_MESCO